MPYISSTPSTAGISRAPFSWQRAPDGAGPACICPPRAGVQNTFGVPTLLCCCFFVAAAVMLACLCVCLRVCVGVRACVSPIPCACPRARGNGVVAGERDLVTIEEYGLAGAGCATAGANDGAPARDLALIGRRPNGYT